LVLFVAQTDPISGGAGWVGAGLLGAVMAWLLLKYLPDQHARQERMVTAHQDTMAAAIGAQRVDFIAAMTQERLDFTVALERILKQNEIQVHHLAEAFNKDMQLTRQLVQELRGAKRGG
jgi:hypothetical protein